MGSREAARSEVGARKRRAPPLRVADVMQREFVAVPSDEPLLEAQRTMKLARLRHLLVVEDGLLVGILSYRDLQDELLERSAREAGAAGIESLGRVPVREAMVPAPYYVRPDTSAAEAARRMLRLHLGCLPVCENGGGSLRLIGLLAESDLLRAAWK